MAGMVNMILDFYRDKKVFVTGHTGFKGAWLCTILCMAGAEVTGFALPPEELSLCRIIRLEEKMNSVHGDMRDLEALRCAFDAAKPEIVLHLAAQPIVRESYRDPVGTYASNVMGTVHILECVRQSGCVRSFLNVTTDKVYQNRQWPWGYRETDVLNGFDPYANSKSCSELVTDSYRNSFLADRGCGQHSAGRKCDWRRRLCGGPDHTGLYPGCVCWPADSAPQPTFRPALSACAGTAVRLSADRTAAV